MRQKLFVIWSLEHQAWWGPGRWGYMARLAEAGRYAESEAQAIIANANVVTFNECAIPVEAFAATRPDLTPGCDCDQVGNPDVLCHASDCQWRSAQGQQPQQLEDDQE